MFPDRLYNLDSFQEQYKNVLILSASLTIERLIWKEDRLKIEKKINWNNILSISSVLCQSQNNEYLDASLRISQTALVVDCSDEQKAAAIYILQKLTNIPAYDLAIKRELINEDLISKLPLKLKFEINRTKVENSININDNIISLNCFQKEVYEKSVINESISISAPTSAGKSFILYQLLLDKLKRVKNIVYIVPTRALIGQVENDLNEFIAKYNIRNTTITSIPRIENSLHNIYVLTQERLHRLYIDNPDFKCNFLLVDEAHKIDNENRGILLERKIVELIDKNPNMEIYFSSPFTSNPELLLEIVKNKEKKAIVNTEFISVNQNLIYVSQQEGNTLIWNLELVTKRHKYEIGHIVLEKGQRPTTETKKVGYLAYALGSKKGGNIVYANGAAQSESYAKIICELQKCKNIKSNSSKVNELIKLVKKSIHKEYILGKILINKVSIHYGNIPLLIRQEIENLFKSNEIDFLICTSTLLEGMNLPSKSIFIKKPQRGNKNPLNENDFWNLAGRAGRWGKEFSGNIFCIEPQLWDIQPNPDKKKQYITKALDDLNKNDQQSFIQYIENNSPREIAEKKPNFEFAFNYYYSSFLNDNLKNENDFERKLYAIFSQISTRIIVPKFIIERNPGVSPIAQQELLEYFERYNKGIKNLIPVYPEDENSYKQYISLIKRIGKTISKFPDGLAPYRSIIVLNWMRGRPLSMLIRDSVKYFEGKKSKKTIDAICREVMADIENFARFRFVKDSSCYIDILKYFLQQRKEEKLLENIPDISLWLEFGVCEETQISLLSLGLSRQTAIELSEIIPNSNLTKIECLEWLQMNDLNNYDLSPILLAEIDNIKKRSYGGYE